MPASSANYCGTGYAVAVNSANCALILLRIRFLLELNKVTGEIEMGHANIRAYVLDSTVKFKNHAPD